MTIYGTLRNVWLSKLEITDMTFLHMHSVMATKAIMQVMYVEGMIDQPMKRRARFQEFVLSGGADYKSRYENIVVTKEDRETVLNFLGYPV